MSDPTPSTPAEVLAEAGAVYGMSPDPVPSNARQSQQDEFGEYAERHLRIYGFDVVRFERKAQPYGESFTLTWDDGTVKRYQPITDGTCPTCEQEVRRVVEVGED